MDKEDTFAERRQHTVTIGYKSSSTDEKRSRVGRWK